MRLTLMLWLLDQLADHSLDDADIAVQQAAHDTPQQRHPDIARHADNDHAQHGANAADEQHGLAANAVGQAAPVHAHEGLGEREGRDEDAGIEGGIAFVADLEVFDQGPCIGEDGCERNRLGQADDGWRKLAVCCFLGGGAIVCIADVCFDSPKMNSWKAGNASGSRVKRCLNRLMSSSVMWSSFGFEDSEL